MTAFKSFFYLFLAGLMVSFFSKLLLWVSFSWVEIKYIKANKFYIRRNKNYFEAGYIVVDCLISWNNYEDFMYTKLFQLLMKELLYFQIFSKIGSSTDLITQVYRTVVDYHNFHYINGDFCIALEFSSYKV